MRCSNVLIVEPNELFREGLRVILHNAEYAVVGVVATAAEGFNLSDACPPELILWGPGAGQQIEAEIAWVRERRSASNRLRLVVLVDMADVGRLQRIVALGVDAVLSHDISSDVLHGSIDLVMLGQQLLPASFARAVAADAPMLPAATLSGPTR